MESQLSEDLNTQFWRKFGDEIDRALQDMDEFGRTRCRICGSYKFTNDIAICIECSLNVTTEKKPVPE